ncbi:hypothetical protein ASD38_02285 [Caulobacter sp. Root487D2Y]|jgi:hypothetical protein|uniref:hypothetical protein n=1 Tax=Caulobacter sp. Root487D2Y TaxID=1736547 RepID=UPI0006F5255C|nr:hypothetical protein [Caulobacter sp. Root487D2Y]KQY35412.1 hypothetical protein ASD38_02285 [Caulobacter sp. Root487D2Y]
MKLQRHGLLALGVLAFAAMALLAFTPIAWMRAGRPDESYPEILYVSLGLPAALIAILAGYMFAKFFALRPRPALIPLQATTLLATLVCGWLVVVGLGPNSRAFDAFAGPSLTALFAFGLPALVVALILSVLIATRSPAAAPNAPRS